MLSHMLHDKVRCDVVVDCRPRRPGHDANSTSCEDQGAVRRSESRQIRSRVAGVGASTTLSGGPLPFRGNPSAGIHCFIQCPNPPGCRKSTRLQAAQDVARQIASSRRAWRTRPSPLSPWPRKLQEIGAPAIGQLRAPLNCSAGRHRIRIEVVRLRFGALDLLQRDGIGS